jgi:hypothetical protein
MSTKAKTLAAIIGLGMVDAVLPGVPIVALILLYVIFDRPPWFSNLVGEIYRGSST